MRELRKPWVIFTSLGLILGFLISLYVGVSEATPSPWEYVVDSESFAFYLTDGIIPFYSGTAYLIKDPCKGHFKVKLQASTELSVTIVPYPKLKYRLGYTSLWDHPYPGLYWGTLNFNFTTILGKGPKRVAIDGEYYNVNSSGDSVSLMDRIVADIEIFPHYVIDDIYGPYDGKIEFSVTLESKPIPFSDWKDTVPVYVRYSQGLFTHEDTLYLSYPMSISKIVEAPSKVSPGQSFTVRWRVTNEYEYRIENVKVHSYVYLYKYDMGETICYNVGGRDSNLEYVDLEPGENKELVQTIIIRSDVEPSAETKLRAEAVFPLQEAESIVYYDTRSINVVPPPESGVVWIFPSDDATVAESYPDAPPTYRTDRIGIRSWGSSHNDIEDYRNIRSFLKFDLSEIPEDAKILDAELRLYCYYAGHTITGVTDVSVLPARDDWTENTITWNNPPWSGDVPDDVLDVWVPPEFVDKYGWPRVWVPWTVTSFVEDEFEGDVTASFCLRAATESYDNQWRNVYFRSKDYDSYDPHLVVTYSG